MSIFQIQLHRCFRKSIRRMWRVLRTGSLFAGSSANMLETMNRNIAMESDRNLAQMMQKVSERMSAYQAGNYLMTDDKAPVEPAWNAGH